METRKFLFNNNEIRVVIDNDGMIWFAGIDVCNVLGYADAHQKIKSLDEDEYRLDRIQDGQGKQKETLTVNEFGFYNLTLTSSKPDAKPFKRWVTHEVLPEIRKTGKYSTEQTNQRELDLQAITRQLADKREQLADSIADVKDLRKEIKELEKQREGIITDYQPKLPFPEFKQLSE